MIAKIKKVWDLTTDDELVEVSDFHVSLENIRRHRKVTIYARCDGLWRVLFEDGPKYEMACYDIYAPRINVPVAYTLQRWVRGGKLVLELL